MNLFLNEQHDLRSGWKVATYTALFVIIWFATALVISMVFTSSDQPLSQLTILAINSAALFVPAVGALLIMSRMIEHVSVTAFGVALHDGWLKDLFIGLAIAAVMLAVLLAGSVLVGGVSITWSGRVASASSLTGTVVLLVLAAANEELVFRGYPLQILMRGVGPWPAMLVLSAIFGILHLSNPDATIFSTINTALAGLLLSIAYLRTRSLWLPYGIHVGWNLGLGFVLGYPLSGIDIDSLWTTSAHGPEWFIGGGYGPEGGLLCSLIFVLAALAVRSTRAVGISLKLREALAMNAGKIYVSENES